MAVSRIHHLNCGTLCPAAGRLVGGSEGGALGRGRMVCHCLLVETPTSGLILVDTGFGTADCAAPERFHRLFRGIVGPRFDPSETALRQVERLGYTASDVRHLVVTHLDHDHAGGLADFPHAQVHVHAVEQRTALARRSPKQRGRTTSAHWAHGPRWSLYEDAGDDWLGFEAVRRLDGIAEDVALVPLFGHSRGHCGVAVAHAGGWLLHAGDAYFHRGELLAARRCPPGLRLFQALVQMDGHARRRNADRLRALHRAHADRVTVFSAHDPVELERLAP